MSASHDFALSVDRRECKVHWEQLCSNEEIWEWFENKKVPRSLHGKLTRPGVYRFLLPLDNKPKLRCYIGETECLERRIGEHLTKTRIKTMTTKEPIVEADPTITAANEDCQLAYLPSKRVQYQANKIQGALINLNNSQLSAPMLKERVSLEELIVEIGYLLGVPVNQDTLNSPFGRKMFENLELLRTHGHCYPMNSGIDIGFKNAFNDFC
jgi:hypothetical protein